MIILANTLNPDFSINRMTILLVLVTLSVPVFQHTQYAQFNTIGILALALSYRALSQKRLSVGGDLGWKAYCSNRRPPFCSCWSLSCGPFYTKSGTTFGWAWG